VNTRTSAKVGAACGIASPLALTAGRSSALMLAVFGLALFVPFLAYICNQLRKAEAEGGWLASAAFGAGLMGMTLKLSSGVPEIAYKGIATGSNAHRALEGLANGATIASLYPFAIFTAIVAVQSLRSNALPHWLGALAGLTAIALLINGSFEYAGTVPGLLMFIIWTLIAGIALFIHELRLQPLRTSEPLASS
jgi:hypothetical protein